MMGSNNSPLRFFLVLFTFAILTVGCIKVGPDYVRPQTSVSHTWLEAGDQRVKMEPAEYRNWWKIFNDNALDRLIDTAYRENLTLRLAGARVLEARAQLGATVGSLFPQTQQATGSVLKNRESAGTPISGTSASAPRFGGLSSWESQVGLTANWEIDFWGKFRRAIESADAGLLASIANYDSTLVSLTGDVANFYITIRTLKRRLDIARHNVRLQRESLQIAEARFVGGTTSQRDVEQAKTVLAGTQATIPILETQLRQAKNALSVLLGLPPNRLIEQLRGKDDIPAPPAQVAVGIPVDLLRRRPDVRAAEYNAMAQSAQIGVSKAQLFPAFSLTGNFGMFSSDVGKNALAEMFNWRNRQGSIGPSVQWNIFNYGQITNLVRVQDARFQQLLITYQNTVLSAQREVEDNLIAFLRIQEQAKFLRESAEAARRSLDLAVLQYREGITDFTTVLTAQQALLSAEDSLANALGNISLNLVGVYRALGGGWELREGQDFVPAATREQMEKRTNWGNLLTPASPPPPTPEEQQQKRLIRGPDW
ncbi:MAG: efflux transporter outer membrane subunit [Deltaproteobacteria bacterium]|nr:efflux transporter outer membrane subunit [Deltaproteobacteria bacterium]